MSKWESGRDETAEWARGRPCGNSGQGKKYGLYYKCVERHQKDLALLCWSFPPADPLWFPDFGIQGYEIGMSECGRLGLPKEDDFFYKIRA